MHLILAKVHVRALPYTGLLSPVTCPSYSFNCQQAVTVRGALVVAGSVLNSMIIMRPLVAGWMKAVYFLSMGVPAGQCPGDA